MFIYMICLFVGSDGFRQLLCEASSCIGIAGNQLKFYTFACKLESKWHSFDHQWILSFFNCVGEFQHLYSTINIVLINKSINCLW